MTWFFFVRRTTRHEGYEYEANSAVGGEVVGFPLDSVAAVRFRRRCTWARTQPAPGSLAEPQALPAFVSVELTTGKTLVFHGEEAGEFLRQFLPQRADMSERLIPFFHCVP